MKNTAIIIPSRLNAQRLPNKPLALINNKEMILHVYEAAMNSGVGEVIVATPDRRISDLVNDFGGKAFVTKRDHQTGTDRVFEVFESRLNKKPDIIINLQGDMPNLHPTAIVNLVEYMKKNLCDIGSLASDLNLTKEENDPNICKVVVSKDIKKENIFARAIDFYRLENNFKKNFIYHHIGIYAFTSKALIRYVGLDRSNLEKKRKLEQLRALENNMKIDIGFTDTSPLSVDTADDLKTIKEIMKK